MTATVLAPAPALAPAANPIEIRGLSAGYGASLILDRLSLTVEPGDRLALIGRNGVGKTTLVNALIGVARVSSGTLTLAGREVRAGAAWIPARSGIAIVPQGRRIVPGLTVEENLILGTAPGRAGPWSLDAVYRLFPILAERRRGPGTALSGGQQQMLAIGRALMSNPTCLVMDEPTEGLAPVIVDQVAGVIDTVASQGTAILLIEQHLGLVTATARRFAVLSKGRIVEDGSLAGLSAADLHHHVAV